MLITENQLDSWVRGNARSAQGLVVELVWRLVGASSPNPVERRFPLGDSIGQHGPDGWLDGEIGLDPFVPDGRSLWEIGTGLDAADKATKDYRDATADVPENVRREATFVFVTPLSARRAWEHTWKGDAQAAWSEDRRNRGEWKDVRVLDGTKLIDWLGQFPSVELWLAEQTIGVPAGQLETPEQRWNLTRSIGEPPPLVPNVFLVDRDEACTKLKDVFEDRAAHLKLETRFPDQTIDFICALLASLDDEKRVDVAGRCVIVAGGEAWNALVAMKEKHFLIADPKLDLSGEEGTRLIQRARRAGHAVIYGGARGGLPDPASVSLPAPRSEQLREALRAAGYSEERARNLANRSGGNLGSLLRCLQNLSIMPQWAETSAAAELAIAEMLGSWNETSVDDIRAVEDLAGKSYGEWIGAIRDVASRPGTPLTQRERVWKFIPRYEGWYALGGKLFDEHIDRLSRLAISVLSEDDPGLDLPSSERYAASIHGRVLKHSQLLRRGLSESLALLGSHPNALQSSSQRKAEITAALSVRSILANTSWRRWASLNELLPLLAEAAPDEFLQTVEAGLEGSPCPFDELFAQEGVGFVDRNYMSGLLWALETLAWDPERLTRVLICLGELAERDPGGRWANRPAESLTSILLPWFPQTCASIEKRFAAVTTLIHELPAVGWKLLVSLLPRSHSTSTGTRRPEWREIIPDNWPRTVTKRSYNEQVTRYSAMAVDLARNDRAKLVQLVDHLESLPPSAQEALLAHLGSPAVTELAEAERQLIWTELVDLITKHQKYRDAEWAMTGEQVGKLSSIATLLAPRTPFFHHQRLFSERDFELYEERGNYEEQRAGLESRRQKAIEEVASDAGVEGVLAFAVSVGSPWRVGIAYGVVAEPGIDRAILPDLLNVEDKRLTQFVGGYVWGRFHGHKWPWVDSLDTSKWTATEVASFLALLPFTMQTWERVERLLASDSAMYWTRTSANPYEASGESDFAIEKLVEFRRPDAALRVFAAMAHEKKQLDTRKLIHALLAALQVSEVGKTPDAYEVVELIRYLQDAPDVDADGIFKVEWGYLPLFDRHSEVRPIFLERRLSTDPDFFCEAVRLVFRSKKADQQVDKEGTEDQKRIAQNAYRLLSEWRTPPGTQEPGDFDGDFLDSWLGAVKEACIASGHFEVAMNLVGSVLTHVPPDPSGLWIHASAANALNMRDSGDMRDGFRNALFNSRGVHFVDPTGKPERELAAKYRSQAESVEFSGYQRLAATLRELAETYDRDADAIRLRHEVDSD